MGAVQRSGNARQGRLAGRGGARPARVEVVEPDAESFAAVEVVEEGVVGLSVLLGIFLREVHEVGAVREDVACGVVFMLVAGGEELISVVVEEGRIFPFALGLEEHGEGVAAYVKAVGHGILHACIRCAY